MHSTHDPDEVQVDPRALSDVTDEEEVQVCNLDLMKVGMRG